MCEMMHEFFEQIKDGQQKRVNQYNRVFPNGVDAVIYAQKSYNFTPIIKAIDDASDLDVSAPLSLKKNDSALFYVLEIFRNDFAPLSKKEANANLKYLFEAFPQYARNKCINKWPKQRSNKHNWGKLDLFWRQAIGFVLFYLPKCD
jgi:hypothetical protein